ncbi:MAG: LysR family transcriptional regulator, partial [Halomonas sp.]|nr:LysR family transcriptional regulator [Halomonas sp.]
MHYTLRQLEVFVAVAQHESVSQAARALAMSQSATSTALAELERQFDCQLLDRIGKRLKLNALGFQLLPKAVALLDRAEEVEELLRGQQGVGALDVGATLTIGNYLATLLISDFMQRYPGSRVRLAVRNTRHIIEGVRQHSLDLGLIEGQCDDDMIISQPWVEDELCVFCS